MNFDLKFVNRFYMVTQSESNKKEIAARVRRRFFFILFSFWRCETEQNRLYLNDVGHIQMDSKIVRVTNNKEQFIV